MKHVDVRQILNTYTLEMQAIFYHFNSYNFLSRNSNLCIIHSIESEFSLVQHEGLQSECPSSWVTFDPCVKRTRKRDK